MFTIGPIHPIFRYGLLFLVLLAALGTLLVSAYLNSNSVAWLAGLYITLPLFLASLRRRKTSELHRAYSLYLAMLGLYLLIVWALHVILPGRDEISHALAKRDAAHWMQLLDVGSIYMPVALFRFTLRFAEVKHPILRGIDRVGWVIFSVFFMTSLGDRFCVDWVWMQYTWVPTLEGPYRVFFYFTTLYVTLGLLVPLCMIFQKQEGPRRLQLFYFLLGGAPLWVACWTNFLISLGVRLYPFGGMAFLLHAVVMGYAVFRRRVFDVQVVVRRGMVYAGVSLSLGIAYGLVLWISSISVGKEIDLHEMVAGGVFVALVGFLCAPLLGLAQQVIDRLFFRQEADRQKLLGEFSMQVASSIHLKDLCALICHTMSVGMGARSVYLYLSDRNGRLSLFGSYLKHFEPERWPSSKMPDIEASTLAAIAQSSVGHAWKQPKSSGGEALRLTEGSDALIVPIRHQGQCLGFALLEPKRADEPYSERDKKFAENVSAQSAVALANARAYRRIEELQQISARTLEGLSAGVLLVASSGEIMLWNRAAQAMIAPEGPRLESLSLQQHNGASSELTQILQQAHWNSTEIQNVEIHLKSPRERTLLMTTNRLVQEDGESTTLVLLHDLTEYKEMESIIRRQEGLAQIGEMISSINHEVRNILQPVHTHMNRLKDQVEGHVPSERSVHVVQDRLFALDKMLSNLRNLARPLALKVRPLELVEVLEHVCADVSSLPNAAGVRFEIKKASGGFSCTGDPQWLRQVFHNLVQNAVEATDGCPARQIQISFDAQDGMVRVTVRDSGWGISDANRKKLFEPFYSTKGTSGTGLGLCLSQRIVEAHGGKIEVWSQEGLGSAFTVCLPQKPTANALII